MARTSSTASLAETVFTGGAAKGVSVVRTWRLPSNSTALKNFELSLVSASLPSMMLSWMK